MLWFHNQFITFHWYFISASAPHGASGPWQTVHILISTTKLTRNGHSLHPERSKERRHLQTQRLTSSNLRISDSIILKSDFLGFFSLLNSLLWGIDMSFGAPHICSGQECLKTCITVSEVGTVLTTCWNRTSLLRGKLWIYAEGWTLAVDPGSTKFLQGCVMHLNQKTSETSTHFDTKIFPMRLQPCQNVLIPCSSDSGRRRQRGSWHRECF